LARRRRIKLEELINEPWVLPPPDSVAWSVAMESFQASGLDYPRATVIAEPFEVRMSFVATGRFLSICPNSALKFSARSTELKVLPVRQQPSQVPVGIITLKKRTISPISRLFIDGTREVAKQLSR
jgi:DNA-binding transcriptional LysR family regulator